MLSKIVAGNILIIILFFFSGKLGLGISCELSALQMIHMKCQALFSLKNEKKKKNEKEKIKMVSASVVIISLRLKFNYK